MDIRTDDELLAAIADCGSRTDICGLEGLFETVLGRPAAVRTALAESWSGCAGQFLMDVEADKIPAVDGYDVAIDAYIACRRLCPADPDFAIGEADTRIQRAEHCPDQAEADVATALAIADRLLAEWTAPDSGDPKFTYSGNFVIPRAPGREDVHRLRARALFLLASHRSGREASEMAAGACAALRQAIAIQLCDGALWTWRHGISVLSEAADPHLHRCAAEAQRDFDACAAERIAAHPIDARWWGEHFTRLADGPPGRDAAASLTRAAAIWRDYACDPALSPREATQVGHLIQRCGRWLGDRGLLLRALAFHEDALARAPDNFQTGYVAGVCTDLATLPGTPADEQRRWYDRAVDACRRFAMPIDDFHFGVHFSELLLARAARFGFPPDHPDLEEAWQRSHHLIASHGEHYLVQSENAAWARLLQGRDDDAVELLRAGRTRIPCVTVDEIARRAWFLALGPERAARIRARLDA